MLRPLHAPSPRSRSGARAALVALLLLPIAQPARAQTFMDGMVRKFCLQAVNKEIKNSGKPAPAGMSDYTCDCVVKEMKNGRSQQQASATCKEAATRKFNL